MDSHGSVSQQTAEPSGIVIFRKIYVSDTDNKFPIFVAISLQCTHFGRRLAPVWL